MSSWGDTFSGLGSAAAAVGGYAIQFAIGSSSESSPSANCSLPTERFNTRLERASLTTIIQIALFGFEPAGSKINFDDNCLSFDPPTFNAKLKRTKEKVVADYVTGEKTGASRNSLTDLKKDFEKARDLYCSDTIEQETLEAIQKIFFYALKGLDALEATYSDTLVIEFTTNAKKIFNDVIGFKKGSPSSSSAPIPISAAAPSLSAAPIEPTTRKPLELAQLSLYRSNEIKLIADAFESNSIKLIQTIVEQKILQWRSDVDTFLQEQFS